MKLRRQVRVMALQVLYEIDLAGHDPDRVMQERLQARPLTEEGQAFMRRLISGVLHSRAAIDGVIARVAPEWPPEQLSPVDRNIMRLAVYEMLLDHQAPYKVAINEAVELAKLFGSDSSSRFINGALGAVAGQRDRLARELAPQPAP